MNELDAKLEKVKKSCRITAKVSRVFEIIMLVSSIVCIVGAAICFGMRNKIDETFSQNSEAQTEIANGFASFDEASFGGALKVTINPDQMIANGEYAKVLVIYCIAAAFVCAMVMIVFCIIRRIFDAIKTSETPFHPSVLKKLKKLFIVIVVELVLMVGTGTAVIVALICWSIYNILDYGYTIQQQVDETL